MKIRTGFVTNSSSSSFLMMRLRSSKVNELLEIYKLYDDFHRLFGYIACEDDGTLRYTEDESCWHECPTSKRDALDLFILTIANNDDFEELLYNDDEISDEDINSLEKSCSSINERFAIDLLRNYDDIEKDIDLIEVVSGDQGWGGDDDSRYDQGSYSDETLQDILSTIAEENNCSIEDVTDDMFANYVGDMTSTSEETFTYSKIDGKETQDFSSSYYIE